MSASMPLTRSLSAGASIGVKLVSPHFPHTYDPDPKLILAVDHESYCGDLRSSSLQSQ